MATVELYKDIGLDPTFKKTIDFTSKAQQRNWFNTKSRVTYDNVNYNKLQNTLKINTDISFDEALSYTYAVITDIEDSSTRRYYCFINRVTLISTETIELELAIDPIQTFMAEYSVGESMITRKHIDRWSSSSSVPINKKPVYEGVDAYYSINKVARITQSITDSTPTAQYHIEPEDCHIAIVCYTDRNTNENVSIKKGIFPCGLVHINSSDKADTQRSKVYRGQVTGSVAYECPSMQEVISGKIPSLFNIAPENIIYIAILPYAPPLYWHNTSTGDGGYTTSMASFGGNVITGNNIAMIEYSDVYSTDPEFTVSVSVNDLVKATSTKTSKSEPELYKEPYRMYKLVDGAGNSVIDFPSNIILDNTTLTLHIRSMIGNNGAANLIYCSDIQTDNQLGSATIVEALYQDVANDKWLTYVLTERDTNRQLVANASLQSAIDNLIFMGYGGSLVASRGASGNDTTQRRQRNILTGVTQAVGLAAGASIVTSLVDAHFAWENQLLNETKIRNSPNNLLKVGTGSMLTNSDTIAFYIVEMVADDNTMNNAYDMYFKYGYMVNRYDKPDVRSRKYFDYILTNGCVIEGSLNTVIKQELAAIYDSGITIFHGDYSSTLDYPTAENIERSLL